jgi:hypothetical protein
MLADVDFEGTLLDVELWDQLLWALVVITSAVFILMFAPTFVTWVLQPGRKPPGDDLPPDATPTNGEAQEAAAPEATEAGPPDDRPVAHRGGLTKVRPRLTKDKRRHLRREGQPTPVLLAGGPSVGEPFVCSVVNRSRGGLGIVVNRRLPPGTVVRVRPVEAPEDVPWVRVQVRNCRRRAQGWYIGCRFTEHLPWSVILVFG